MSHDAHHTESKIKPQAAGKPSFWFVVIIVGLFIAAINFVNVMGHDSDEGHGAATHGTEHHATEKHTTQGATHIEGTPQEKIAEDPAMKQSEVSDTPHEENAPNKALSEAEEH